MHTQQQDVQQARQRRAVTARGDVANAHVLDDRRSRSLRDPRALADLQRAERVAALHPVKDGLAVRAHDVGFAVKELIGEIARDFGEVLADQRVELADLFDRGRVSGQDELDATMQVTRVLDRVMSE